MLFLAVLGANISFAQTADQEAAPLSFLSKNLIIPPSPEAASLGQYGNTPVSLYNGRINLSVPLYTIKGKEISLPISMSYNSGGAKVQEDHGWIGLGWTLNAGGVITRSVVGRPDLCETYYSMKSEITQGTIGMTPIEAQDFYKEIIEGRMETQPDPHFYNFAGLQGKFFLNLDKEVVLLEHKPVSILFSGICGEESTVTAKGPDGTTYFFGDRETTELHYDDGGSLFANDFMYTSSWHLTRIISANRLDTIRFEYDSTSLIPLVFSPETQSVSYTVHGWTSSLQGPTAPCGEVKNSNGASGSTSISRKYLKKITYRDTELFIHSSVNDTSAFGGRRVDSIKVMINGVRLKKFDLAHGHFNDPSKSFDERLRLDSVVEYGHLLKAAPPYKFEYESSVLLPPIQSKGLDHWGYYNGADGNSSLIPTLQNGSCELGYGANREVSEGNIKAGSLKKVTYPTGGYTEFDFGPHRKIATAGPSMEVVESQYPVEALVIGGINGSGQSCAAYPRFSIVSFKVADSVTRVSVSAPGNVWDEQQNGEGAKVFAGIIKAENFDFQGCDMFAYATTHLSSFEYFWFLEEDAWPLSNFSGLSAGDYKLIALSGDAEETVHIELDRFVARLEQVPPTQQEQFVGGLRIERITDYAADASVALVREYEYQDGKTFGDPQYFSLSNYFREAPEGQGMGEIQVDYNAYTLTLSSSSKSSLGSVMGSHIGYGKVTEKFTGPNGATNGFKVYAYRNDNLSGSGNSFGYDLDEFGQGDLLQESIYNDSEKLVRETINEYSMDAGENRYRPSLFGMIAYASPTQSNELTLASLISQPSTFEWFYVTNEPDTTFSTEAGHRKTFSVKNQVTSYLISGHWPYLSSTSVRDSSTTGEMITQTRYFYDALLHAQPSSIERVTSLGDTLITKIKYTNASIEGVSWSADVARDEMLDRHVLTTPIQKTVVKNGEGVLSAQRIEYELVSGNPFPKDVLVVEESTLVNENSLADKFKRRATYKYSSSGDLVEYSKSDDVLQGFLWSSDHKNVIAEVTGAVVGAIAYTGFEDGDQGGWIFSGTPSTAPNDSLHSGAKRYSLSTGQLEKSGLVAAAQYVVAFYRRPGGTIAIGGGGTVSAPTSVPDRNGWLLQRYVVTNATTITISGTAVIDDIRLHPLHALMTTYTHDPLHGITASTDPNNITNFFDYDDAGRLVRVRDAQGNVVKSTSYHYKH